MDKSERESLAFLSASAVNPQSPARFFSIGFRSFHNARPLVSTFSRSLIFHSDFIPPLAMVQGKTKGLQHKASSSRHAAKAAAKTKKGQRHIAPKQPGLVKQATLHQVRPSIPSPVRAMGRRN